MKTPAGGRATVRRHARFSWWRFVAGAFVALLMVAGCGGGERSSRAAARSSTGSSTAGGSSTTGGSSTAGAASAAPTHQPIGPNGQPIPRLSTPGTPKGEQMVSIVVVATAGRDKRQALALVPVYINGQGPFPFAVDTGASRSLIASSLARRLRLPSGGSGPTLYGIIGGAQAQNVVVKRWRAGNVSLPSEVIATLDQPGAGGGSSGATRNGPVGLLGSDVLSRYGRIAIDYDRGLLILDPQVK